MAIANSQIRVIVENLARSATLSATPVPSLVSTMPVENVQNSNRTESFRSTAVDENGLTIAFELPERKRISALVLDGHNLRVGDTYQLRLWSGPNKTGTLFESDVAEALVPKTAGELNWGIDTLSASVFDEWDRPYSVLWFGSIVAQSGEIVIISDGNPAGYIDINRILFGQAVSPVRNFRYGYELSYSSTSKLEFSEGGSPKRDVGIKRRSIRLTLPRILDAERSAWADFIRNTADFDEIFVSLFPERGGKLERDHSMVCYVTSTSGLRNSNATKHTLEFALQEA
ncbi:MAG: hypothetical protein R3332_08290 [Pseudohongiellaceae bacterium]|nr:hypothetical protein [Pseudohongiellaceae bacterium]